jgi:hypothetical protein
MSHDRIVWNSKRTKCPSCGSRDGFAGIKTIDGIACGDPLQHGKCHSCGVMLWPDDAPQDHAAVIPKQERQPSKHVRAGLIDETDGQTSNLHRALINIGGDGMAAHLRQWRIGTDFKGRTLFHYVNMRGHHQTTKAMQYNIGGNRDADTAPKWGVQLPSGYVDLSTKSDHRACLFGEHWMQEGQSMIDYRDPLNPRKCSFNDRTLIALVESEKSAVVASYMMPNIIWIATGGIDMITEERAKALASRTVLILFDCDDAGRKGAREKSQIIAKAGGHAIHEIDGKPVQDHVFSGAREKYDIADHIMDMLAISAASQIGSALHISEGAA